MSKARTPWAVLAERHPGRAFYRRIDLQADSIEFLPVDGLAAFSEGGTTIIYPGVPEDRTPEDLVREFDLVWMAQNAAPTA